MAVGSAVVRARVLRAGPALAHRPWRRDAAALSRPAVSAPAPVAAAGPALTAAPAPAQPSAAEPAPTDHIISEWPDGLGAPQLGGYMRGLEREGVRTPFCTRRLVQDRQILTWTTWPSRLVLNGRPLVLNNCSMGVFSGSTSATNVRSPPARAILGDDG